VSSTVHTSVRLPTGLHEQIEAAARAERRTFSSLLVALLDRGVVERAEQRQLVEQALQADRKAA
jgi:hypothetical protein